MITMRLWTLLIGVAMVLAPMCPDSFPVVKAEQTGSGWKEHWIRVGDGAGGWRAVKTECQILRYRERGWSVGFGLAQMDNGEIALTGICSPRKSFWYGGGQDEKTIICFSKDRGNTWSDFQHIDGAIGRPITLAYLGGGKLTFASGERWSSSDYGRTWSNVPLQLARNGGGFHKEGNPLVDRDEQGMATRIAEIGYNNTDKPPGSQDFYFGLNRIRWSYDGGRTWRDEVKPANWAASEGSVVRAANGDLVAALRCASSVPYPGAHGDEFRSTRVSISKDDGKTWSDPKWIFDGRMHPHLLRLPNGDIVMTVTVRHDLADEKLVSYRRGCEAVISHDNGLTWDLDRKYILDEWEMYDSLNPSWGYAGHLYATLLDDGSILTVHNNYLTMGMTLIRWRP